MSLREQYDTILAKGLALGTKVKAEGRDFTPEELAAAAEIQRQAADLEPKLKQYDEDQKVKQYIADLGAGLGVTENTTGEPAGVKALPATKDTGPMPEWVKHKPMTTWAKNTLDQYSRTANAGGTKAIISGTITVGAPIQAGIDRLPSYPTRVLDLLVDRQPLGEGNTYTWWQQTVETNNAAMVADAGLKPTSIYTFVEREGRVRVIAHLSEPLPERFLSDYAGLGEFLEAEMEEGLQRALEAQVVTGAGTGELLTGITATSGVLVQEFDTDVLTTMRTAAASLEIVGNVPNAWVVHPSDSAAIDLLTDNEARYYYAGPQTAGSNPIWSVPVVKSVAVPVGTAILGDWNKAKLIVREDVNLSVNRFDTTLFDYNLFKMRVEARVGFAVLRPNAFCLVETVATP